MDSSCARIFSSFQDVFRLVTGIWSMTFSYRQSSSKASCPQRAREILQPQQRISCFGGENKKPSVTLTNMQHILKHKHHTSSIRNERFYVLLTIICVIHVAKRKQRTFLALPILFKCKSSYLLSHTCTLNTKELNRRSTDNTRNQNEKRNIVNSSSKPPGSSFV